MKLTRNVFWFAAMGLATLVMSAQAQISRGGIPRSFSMTQVAAAPSVAMPPVDVQALLAEDEQESKDVPFRFGAPLDVNLNLNNSGEWTDLPDGGRIWRLRITSPGAYSINLLYDDFYLADGADLFLYNDLQDHVIGAFTGEDNNFEARTFITAPVKDDAVTLEFYEPADARDQSVISIFRVVHAYRNLFGRPSPLDDFGDSGTCENNINCAVGANWQDEKHGAAMILTSGGFRWCSGSLVGNTGGTTTPYFLTAEHCLDGNQSIWMFMFNYESPTCTDEDGPTNQTVSNATLRASNQDSDFALLQLSSNVPAIYSPYFNGWNRGTTAATNTVGIHHPEGDIKKISFDNNAPSSSTWSGIPGSHWRINAWDDGVTEPGSSGSPLFDQNSRIVGQLTGGASTCAQPTLDDYYGKFSMSWDGNGSGNASSRLQDWLDPDGGAAPTTIDGYYGPTASITVTSPNGGEVWAIGSPQTITWTSQNITQNVRIELNRNYPGGAWENISAGTANDGSHPWTPTGAITSNARIRISVSIVSSINDESDADFVLGTRSVTVTAPNGGETWFGGDNQTVTWTSQNVTGNVNIELSRNGSGGPWETIVLGTPNDGSHVWAVTTPTTSSARVRITSVDFPGTTDMSNANFTISARTITVTAPNGGETWIEGTNQNVTWSSLNVTGNVTIELNRNYPGGGWETIVLGTTNDGTHSWPVTSPSTSLARVRITSVSFPAINDVSDNNFTIQSANPPPVLLHDRLDDQDEALFNVTAIATDNTGGLIVKVFYRLIGAASYDSLAMPATGNPDEFAAALSLAAGVYEYFVRATDSQGLSTSTAVLNFDVREFCGTEQSYDDGSAEASHWSENNDFRWAVKFSHGAGVYTLCRGQVGVSALHPSQDYSSLQISVLLADGPGGLPGTEVLTKSIGSLGNVIGGVPTDTDNFVDVVFSDEVGGDVILTQDFYIAVSNPVEGMYDAFLHDMDGAIAGQSFVYDACDEQWIDETVVHESARNGNRMIRVFGLALVPPVIVVHAEGDDIVLDWDDAGAPFYKIYSSTVSGGPFTTLEGSTSSLTFTDIGAATVDALKFYIVYSSTEP